MFNGIPIKVSEYMAHCKKAVFVDGVLHVSPAMYSLMQGATSEELEQLLANLPVLNLGHITQNFTDLLPMTTHHDT